MINGLQTWWTTLTSRDVIWLAIGLTGQLLFSARWIVQWVASEKCRRSTIPEVFWYLSFVGGLLVLSYGIRKMDPVVVLGQFGVLIYARNLFFIRKEKTGGVSPAIVAAE